MVNRNILDVAGFDAWASSYDNAVKQSDESKRYPFVGYDDIIADIHEIVDQYQPCNILDMGIGTGTKTALLYNKGNKITGIDFSKEMLNLAMEKMPRARLLNWDFCKAVPKELEESKFDIILFTYSIHHLTDDDKIGLINNLSGLLDENGMIIIGDVMTQDRYQMVKAQNLDDDIWDYDEDYIVVDEIVPRLNHMDSTFIPKSYCSGILVAKKVAKN